MGNFDVHFYTEDGETASVLMWIKELSERMQEKARNMVALLQEFGNTLRRPKADYLKEGVYKLRWKSPEFNYRILYGFHARKAIVLLHATTKEKRFKPGEVELAIERLKRVKNNPRRYLL